ncbi:MAG: MFS transporter [Cytophagales bacterium]|nr:MFS transporter [Armatimonadota bacterium]
MGETEQVRERRWQWATIALLVLGYSGYYLCRANFSVSKPMIITELAASGGMTEAAAKIALGAVASWGTLAYACGKFVSGNIADTRGGRGAFLSGMIGAVACTILFALGGNLPLFTLAWIGNRAVQSLGWPGLVRISSRWFSFASYGTVLGVLSLSYLFGDAASRAFMGYLIGAGLSWRSVYFVAAGILALALVANALLLRDTPKQLGLPEPDDAPSSVYAADPSGEKSVEPRLTLAARLAPLLRAPAFWWVCLMSLGFTLLRETFNEWTPTYFTEALHFSDAVAARSSALFPLFGGVSVVLAGFLSDRLGRGGRARLILAGLIVTAGLLVLLGSAPPALVVPLVSLIGFVMIGPYSYLAGAVALDFGGKRGGATACGIIDGVGYLGGVLAGQKVAQLSVAYGWQGAFLALSGVAGLSAVAGLFFLFDQNRAVARGAHTAPPLREETLGNAI